MRFGGIVLVVLLSLGACSSDPEPKEPTPSATTPTPTATSPSMPAQAEEDSPEGAAAFVGYYVAIFNYASHSGDVSELTRLSSSRCEGCQSYIKLIRDTYTAGGYLKGGNWSVSDLEVEPFGRGERVFAHLTAPPGVQRANRSGRVTSTSGEDAELIFELAGDEARVVLDLSRSAR